MANLAGVPSKQLLSFVSQFLAACDSPLSGVARSRDWAKLVSADMDMSITETNEFRLAYYAAEAFSKFPFPLKGVDREKVALKKFFEAEESCKRSNERLCEGLSRASLPRDLLVKARAAIADVLGKFSWDDAVTWMSFGPGASTTVPYRDACAANKWAFGSQVTRSCLPLVLALRHWWKVDLGSIEVCAGNRVTTVPKNAKTDRVIAIEPDWNMFCQRGIGGLIRRRLQSRLGLLTREAQTRNREAAREGSLTGDLATLDLKSASDSISLALCELLLPPDWFRAICLTRSECGEIDGREVLYEKVSSMGNGFTFELETLLFWGLCKAVCGRSRILVYGDDIVVETRYAEQVVNLLQCCGFELNSKKSFWSGPFRESCGGHYHNGYDVTPPYFKDDIVEQHELIRAANKISRAASRRYDGVRDARFLGVFSSLASLVEKHHYGPEHLGDSVLWAPFEDASPRRSIQRYVKVGGRNVLGPTPVGNWEVRALVQTRVIASPDQQGGMWASIFPKMPTEESFQNLGGVYRRKWICVGRWDAPGPWLDLDNLGN